MDLVGKQLSLYAVTIFLAAVSCMTVALRFAARILIRGLGKDDYLMLVAQALYITTCVFSALSAYMGVGRRNSDARNSIQAIRYLYLIEVFYFLTIGFVRASICFNLLRYTTNDKRLRYVIYVLLALSTAAAFAALVMTLNICHPISNIWSVATSARVTCHSQHYITTTAYVNSALNLMTDFGCAIVPTLLLWNVQMDLRSKITVIAILSLGFLASSAIIVRLPLIQYYNVKVNYFWHLSDVTLWTVIEAGLGVIAGSAATLRPLALCLGGAIHATVCSKHERKGDLVSEHHAANPITKDENLDKYDTPRQHALTSTRTVTDETDDAFFQKYMGRESCSLDAV